VPGQYGSCGRHCHLVPTASYCMHTRSEARGVLHAAAAVGAQLHTRASYVCHVRYENQELLFRGAGTVWLLWPTLPFGAYCLLLHTRSEARGLLHAAAAVGA